MINFYSDGESPPKKRKTTKHNQSQQVEVESVAATSAARPSRNSRTPDSTSVTLGEEDSSSDDESFLEDNEPSEEEFLSESESDSVVQEQIITNHRPRAAVSSTTIMGTPKKYSTPSRTKKNRDKSATNMIDSELSGMMNSSLNVSSAIKKKMKKTEFEKSFFSTKAPFLLYHWEDENSNNRLTLEVLLFGAIDESKLTFCLEEPNPVTGSQILSFSNPLPPAWLSMRVFEKNRDMKDYNTIKQHSARRRLLVDLEDNYSTSDSNQILSQQKFLLPYQVENFNGQHPYQGTGYFLDKRPVVKRGGNSAKVNDIMNVLVVEMVSEEKCMKTKKKKARHTFYSKACTYEAASSESRSDDDEDVSSNQHTSRTMNNHRRSRSRSSRKFQQQQQHTSRFHQARATFSSPQETSGNLGDDNLSVDDNMEISLGDQDIELSFETADGTGYKSPHSKSNF